MDESQLKLACYIEKHNSNTLSGTKRFSEKRSEYYLKSVFQKKKKIIKKLCKVLSLSEPLI